LLTNVLTTITIAAARTGGKKAATRHLQHREDADPAEDE
jgi:hypothetical protein